MLREGAATKFRNWSMAAKKTCFLKCELFENYLTEKQLNSLHKGFISSEKFTL